LLHRLFAAAYVQNAPNYPAGISLELALHMLCGLILGLAFINDNYFLPPVPPSYVPFCPEPLQDTCKNEPVNEPVLLMITFTVRTGLTMSNGCSRTCSFNPQCFIVFFPGHGAWSYSWIHGVPQFRC